MRELVDLIKEISLNAEETTKPVQICFGNVISEDPLEVRLSQKLILTKEHFLVRQEDSNIAYQTGDVLILFRVQGGQRYLIFGRKGEL